MSTAQRQDPNMSKKPKFLYRPSEYGELFAAIGRRLKAVKKDGVADWGIKNRFIEVRELLKNRKVTIRHYKWLQVYEAAYEEAYSRAVNVLEKTETQALKYARQKGEQAVVEAFPDEVSTTRAVRDAMNELQLHGN